MANFTAVHLLKKTFMSSVTLCFNFDVSLFTVVFPHSLLVVLSQTPTVPKHKSSSSFTPFIDPRLLQVSPSTGSALNNAGKCARCSSLCLQQRSWAGLFHYKSLTVTSRASWNNFWGNQHDATDSANWNFLEYFEQYRTWQGNFQKTILTFY